MLVCFLVYRPSPPKDAHLVLYRVDEVCDERKDDEENDDDYRNGDVFLNHDGS